MLDRYRKSGGFIQLLQLIETCGKQKQQKFLDIIEEEDSLWADSIREKMITMEKVLTWPSEVLSEIVPQVHQLTWAIALHGLGKDKADILFQTLSHGQRRSIMDTHESKEPSPGEVSASYVQILESIRDMIKHGQIRLDQFAPELVVEDDIEENLGEKSTPLQTVEAKLENEKSAPKMNQPAKSTPNQASVGSSQIQQKIALITKENQVLRQEVKNLKEKLANIRRLAG